MKKYISALMSPIVFCIIAVFVACNSGDDSADKIVDYNGEYLCISLRQYLNEFSNLVDAHKPISDEMDEMYGLSWIDGYVIDYKNKDIILVGKQKTGRPVFHAQDLITNYQNVFDSTSAPYCSLDPYPENMLKLKRYLAEKNDDSIALINNCQEAVGGQRVVVGGVPLNSNAAKVMIYADYDMKKISQGLKKINGIRSTIDFSILDTTDQSTTKSSMSRYWLHIKEDDGRSYPNFNANEGIVFINECPVVVLTQKQYADSEGNLKDDISNKDDIANSFAAEMSKQYNSLATVNPLFAELENMFRLQACLQAMKFKAAIDSAGIDLSKMNGLKLSKGNELPVSLPGLINHRQVKNDRNIWFFIVAGGVDQKMNIGGNNLIDDSNDLLLEASALIISNRPNPHSSHWKAIIGKKVENVKFK